jgi:hypothetical protein
MAVHSCLCCVICRVGRYLQAQQCVLSENCQSKRYRLHVVFCGCFSSGGRANWRYAGYNACGRVRTDTLQITGAMRAVFDGPRPLWLVVSTVLEVVLRMRLCRQMLLHLCGP